MSVEIVFWNISVGSEAPNWGQRFKVSSRSKDNYLRVKGWYVQDSLCQPQYEYTTPVGPLMIAQDFHVAIFRLETWGRHTYSSTLKCTPERTKIMYSIMAGLRCNLWISISGHQQLCEHLSNHRFSSPKHHRRVRYFLDLGLLALWRTLVLIGKATREKPIQAKKQQTSLR